MTDKEPLQDGHGAIRDQALPLGVKLLGKINFYLLGIVAFLASVFTYISAAPKDLPRILAALSRAGWEVQLSYEELKASSLASVFIAAIYIVSGWGLLRRKEWARRLTVYFAFGWVALYFLVALANPPAISQVFIQVVYPGILIFYFTSRKIEAVFKK